MLAINFNPNLLEALKSIQLPIGSIDDLTGRDTTAVAVFSDYGPDNTPFQTFAFYITDLHTSVHLTTLLHEIKSKHGAANRTIDYKGRKDKLKRRAFHEWIKAVRSWPGLLYIAAVDRRLESIPSLRKEAARHKEEFSKVGLCDYNLYSRMFGALTFLSVLSPCLGKKHKIGWITDKDILIDTPSRQDTLVRTFGYYAESLLNKDLSDIRIVTLDDETDPESILFNRHAREMLSIADIAASALAASLVVDEDGQVTLSCPDDEAIDMIQEISKFEDISDYRIESRLSCPLLASIFLLDHSEEGFPFYRHNTLTLSYDSKRDPLREVQWASEGSDINLEVLRAVTF
jgi:hypothetical protein